MSPGLPVQRGCGTESHHNVWSQWKQEDRWLSTGSEIIGGIMGSVKEERRTTAEYHARMVFVFPSPLDGCELME